MCQRFKERGRGIHLIIYLVVGFLLLDDPEIHQIAKLPLGRLEGEARFKHDLPLIK